MLHSKSSTAIRAGKGCWLSLSGESWQSLTEYWLSCCFLFCTSLFNNQTPPLRNICLLLIERVLSQKWQSSNWDKYGLEEARSRAQQAHPLSTVSSGFLSLMRGSLLESQLELGKLLTGLPIQAQHSSNHWSSWKKQFLESSPLPSRQRTKSQSNGKVWSLLWLIQAWEKKVTYWLSLITGAVHQ